jgi:hypothetical protein
MSITPDNRDYEWQPEALPADGLIIKHLKNQETTPTL